MATDFQLFTSLRYDTSLLGVPSSTFDHGGWNYANASPLYMLDFHRDRILRAAIHWGWDAVIATLSGDAGLNTLSNVVLQKIGTDAKDVPMKAKVTVSEDGEMAVDLAEIAETPLANLYPKILPAPGESLAGTGQPAPTLPQKLPAYEVVVTDLKATKSEYTHFKTTKRRVYDQARQRARISLVDKKEVLIVNEADGSVMEGSTTTPYFWRDGRWATPAVSRQYNPERGSGGQDGTSRRWVLERGLAVEDTIPADSLVENEECWLSNGVRGFIFGRVKLMKD